jgi:oligoribonuclease (3'-5' exoribonuclease)
MQLRNGDQEALNLIQELVPDFRTEIAGNSVCTRTGFKINFLY